MDGDGAEKLEANADDSCLHGGSDKGAAGLVEQMNLSSPSQSLSEEESGTNSPPELGLKQQGVKRHNHKHNLKHRYELMETLGKGTYGKVKRAIERFSGRVVSSITPSHLH